MLAMSLKRDEWATIHHQGETARVQIVKRPNGELMLRIDAPMNFAVIRDRARHKRTPSPTGSEPPVRVTAQRHGRTPDREQPPH